MTTTRASRLAFVLLSTLLLPACGDDTPTSDVARAAIAITVDPSPVELEEAAALEGWSRLQIFRRVVFPLLRNGIVASAVLCFIFAWNEFLFAFMLGGEGVQTLPVVIPTLITAQGVRWGELAVVGMVALVPVLAVVFLLQRHIVRGLTLGAVKG